MARLYWSGQIQISLVSFGVSLFVATESKAANSFHQISRSTVERVRHQKVLQSSVDNPSDEAGTKVGKDEIVRGYEYTKGQYVVIEPSELQNLRVPYKHAIAVTQFIDQADCIQSMSRSPTTSCLKTLHRPKRLPLCARRW